MSQVFASMNTALLVRKHPAPEGALRLTNQNVGNKEVGSQKAPSTRRCIKTAGVKRLLVILSSSESTQHQKVH